MDRISNRTKHAVVALGSASVLCTVACGNGVDSMSGPRALRPDGGGVGGSFGGSFDPVTIVGSGGDLGSAGSDDPTGVGGSGGFGGSDGVDAAASRPDATRPRDAASDVRRVDASDATAEREASNDAGETGAKDASVDRVSVEAGPPEASVSEASTPDVGSDATPDVSQADAAVDASLAVDACSALSGPESAFYLSDLPFAGTPVNGFGPVERNTSNGEALAGDGHMISIGGISYPKGLGVHANSSVEFRIDGKCTVFTAYVGADDEVNAASVTFEVWVDGLRTYSSPSLVQSGQPPTFVSVNVTCATSLRLVVTDGVVNANTADHADWANAQVSCSSAPGAGMSDQ